ncbi:unnamed protein product [marine sediment metagenome]|uniref:Uncharacterized protein n=1 Tax=marine sediment metagenome TaxID=412755 RepID=X1W2U9_9ZZZZ
MPEERISPALLVIPVGLGLAAVLGLAALAWAAPKGLQEGDNIVRWTKGPTMVEDALADIVDYVRFFWVLRETDQVWIEIRKDIWDSWAIPRDQICGIVVDRACTMPEGFMAFLSNLFPIL